MMRKLKSRLKDLFFKVHKSGLKVGLCVIPVHYYSPVPNILELEKTKNIWAKKSEMPGIAIDLDEQIENLRSVCLPYQNEYSGNHIYNAALAEGLGPGFGYIEAQALHGFVRYFKPRIVIEVGSGVSTFCSLKALKMNMAETGENFELTCVEPYPAKSLERLGGITLFRQPVQTLKTDFFDRLGAGDLLFIDSSHTVKTGSDVNFLILEILPRLKPGVFVHFHDIFFPFDYSRSVLNSFFDWSETSLLRAFMINNDKIKIIFCLSHLHYERLDQLRTVFPEYEPQASDNGMVDSACKPFEHSPLHFAASMFLQIQSR
jgi:hypothetical protein